MAGPNLDPIEVAKVVAGLAVSQQLAGIVGPYAVILLASVAGAAAALGNADPLGRVPSFWFFSRACLASTLLTVPAASLISMYNDSWDSQVFFIPAAFAISYCADKTKSIAAWLGDTVRSWVKNWVNKGNTKDEP